MSKTDTGGQAFPCPIGYTPEHGGGQYNRHQAGMSHRAYVATKAMSVLLAFDLTLPVDRQQGKEWVAAQAYAMADAMIKEA